MRDHIDEIVDWQMRDMPPEIHQCNNCRTCWNGPISICPHCGLDSDRSTY